RHEGDERQQRGAISKAEPACPFGPYPPLIRREIFKGKPFDHDATPVGVAGRALPGVRWFAHRRSCCSRGAGCRCPRACSRLLNSKRCANDENLTSFTAASAR